MNEFESADPPVSRASVLGDTLRQREANQRRIGYIAGTICAGIAFFAGNKAGEDHPSQRATDRITFESVEKTIWLKAAFDALDKRLKVIVDDKESAPEDRVLALRAILSEITTLQQTYPIRAQAPAFKKIA